MLGLFTKIEYWSIRHITPTLAWWIKSDGRPV